MSGKVLFNWIRQGKKATKQVLMQGILTPMIRRIIHKNAMSFIDFVISMSYEV